MVLSNKNKLSLLKIINDSGIKKMASSLNDTAVIIDNFEEITDDVINTLLTKIEADKQFLNSIQSQLSILLESADLTIYRPIKSANLPDLVVDRGDYVSCNSFQRFMRFVINLCRR